MLDSAANNHKEDYKILIIGLIVKKSLLAKKKLLI